MISLQAEAHGAPVRLWIHKQNLVLALVRIPLWDLSLGESQPNSRALPCHEIMLHGYQNGLVSKL